MLSYFLLKQKSKLLLLLLREFCTYFYEIQIEKKIIIFSDFFSFFRWSWTCSFFVSKFVENITNAIESSGSYFLFGSICALGAVFVITYLPETKGKTNDDMKQFFMKR